VVCDQVVHDQVVRDRLTGPALAAVPPWDLGVGRRPRIGPAELAAHLGLPRPTPEQSAVIAAPLAPAVVVAGAGSGKTETMSARVVWLVANGYVRPEEVLGLTFTNKAAAELAARLRVRLGALARAGLTVPPPAGPPGPVGSGGEATEATDGGEPTVLTYHAYAARLVAEHALRLAVEPSARLLTDALCWQLAARVVRSFDGDLPNVDAAESTVVNRTLDLAGELAEHLAGAEDLRAWTERLIDQIERLPAGPRYPGPGAEVRRILAAARARCDLLPLVQRYARAKRDAAAMDFGDQVSLAARIADRFGEVGRAERGRYAVVLLDEFQDTGHAQLVLLRALFGGGHPVTAVGDPCQSIYGWRGASAGGLARFPAHFPARGGRPATVLPLTTSFRNDRRILDVANLLSGPLRADVGVLTAGPAAGPGQVRAALLHTADDEAAWVADRVAAEWAADEPRRAAGRAGRSVAVLCRRRSQFERLAGQLRARGIPVELVGLGGLLATPEVRDLVSTLRVVADPTAGDAVARLLTGARWRLGPRDLAALGQRSRQLARTGTGAAPDGTTPGGATPDGTTSSGTASGGTGSGGTGSDGTASSGTGSGGAASGGTGSGGTAPDGAVPAPPGPPDPAEAPDPDRVEDASLVEALDDPGPAEAYTAEGYRRLTALREELAGLRRRVGQPLPELVADVERTLLLDIEVGLRGPAGRVHLDRFLDVAARFAEDAEVATLGAFLAYLAAAEQTERGLEAGVVEVAADRVQVLTVHAAKGLEWDVVAVPGLTAGVFPDREASTGSGWATDSAALPYPLRGDAADLPAFIPAAAADQAELERLRRAFAAACRARGEREERRLAYVAVTRARRLLLCSGYRWDDATRPREPSPFLVEVATAANVDCWAEEPAEGETNPLLAQRREVPWPYDPLGGRRADVAEGARLVRAAMARAAVVPAPGAEPGPADDALAPEEVALEEVASEEVTPAEAASTKVTAEEVAGAGWRREADLLLAERAARAAAARRVDVPVPAHLSVSALVALARDPAELARQIRRPLPYRPAPLARRGTAFHAWLEERYGGGRLLDLDELPGAADEGAAPDEDLALLQQRFEASPWADRVPVEVEVPFEAVLSGVVVRGRMDAVFADADGGFTVVDWKTGAQPSGAAARAAAVQLAAYRLAWARLAGVPVDRVRAAFHYVRHEVTVRPVDLLAEDGLRALLDDLPPAGAGPAASDEVVRR
jgi:DNA helicase-2/ATP-dependent DNA helicase PcrA